MFVTCLIFLTSARNVEETFSLFFVFLRFALIRNWFRLKNAFVFAKCFLSNISFGILKLFVFHAVANLLAQNWLEKKKQKKKNKQSPRQLKFLNPWFRLVSL